MVTVDVLIPNTLKEVSLTVGMDPLLRAMMQLSKRMSTLSGKAAEMC